MNKELTITQIREEYLRCCAMIDAETEEIGLTSFRTHQENLIWKRDWFEKAEEVAFENTTINCPEKSDKILEKTYGDWKTPVKKSVHEFLYIDPTIPFNEFFRNKIRED